MLFKAIPIYIKIYFNAIEVTNLLNNTTKKKPAIDNFSTKRIVIADFNIAEKLLRETIEEVVPKKGLFLNTYKTLIQIVEDLDGGITELEKRGLRDLAEQAGSKEVYLLLSSKKITNLEASTRLETLDGLSV